MEESTAPSLRGVMNADRVLEAWHGRTGEFSPGYYAYYGANEVSNHIRRQLDEYRQKDARILEIGCSAGRHLAHLQDHGYEDLSGIDINHEMIEVLTETYPALAESGRFYADAVENVIPEFDDNRFEAVFTVETLQHIHQDNAWVFDEIARVTADILVTAEMEGEGGPPSEHPMTYVNDDIPLYYRDWGRVFSNHGFDEVDSSQVGRDTVRVFRNPQA